MLLCAEVNAEDFRVIHHEMGHVEYYMAYRNQPVVFQVHSSHGIDTLLISSQAQEVGIPALHSGGPEYKSKSKDLLFQLKSSHAFLSPSWSHQNLWTTNNEICLQEGANSAFQEAVGDAVMYGVMAPQHLQRLGFINDTSQGNFIQSNLTSTHLWHFYLRFLCVSILYSASVCMLHVNLTPCSDFSFSRPTTDCISSIH
jgi:hypothetical protein